MTGAPAWKLLLTLALLGMPQAVRGEARPVSVLGSADVQQKSVRVSDGSVVQILLDEHWAVGLVGPLRVRMDSSQGQISLLEDSGTVRLAGKGGVLSTRDGWQIKLISDDASVLFSTKKLFVLRGKVVCAPPSRSASRPTPRTLSSAQTARLGSDGALQLIDDSPDPALVMQSQAYQPPAPWTPQVTRFSQDLVRQASAWTQQQQQAAKEMATCGCTEGSGSGVGPVDGPDALKPPEQRRATIRVRVRGIPRIGQ